jgi:large subunit ribosomal protein L30
MAVKENPKPKSKSKRDDSVDKQLKIKLKRSLIGHPRKHREVVKGLGLRKVNSEVIRKDCPEIRGMINKISYLVEVKELETK